MFRNVAAFALATLAVATDCAAQAQKPEDVVLAENGVVKLTRADYEADLLRIPADKRAEFAASPSRLTMFLNNLLIDKTLAQEAHSSGLDRDPELSRRLALEADRFWARAMLAKIERDAAADFDAREQEFLAKARETYLIDKDKYKVPEEVRASHILFDTKKRGEAEALALAKSTREKLLAGADFDKLAAELSDDPSVKENDGHLGWFGSGVMDPEFTKAAFALKNVGDLSEPVASSFGYHIIRLDGRRPPHELPFDRVRKQIMAELKQRYVADVRNAKLEAITRDPAIKVNQAAVDALVVKLPEQAPRFSPPAVPLAK